MTSLGGIFDFDNAILTLEELNKKSEDPLLWNDQKHAQSILKERDTLLKKINTIKNLELALSDTVTLFELGDEMCDESSKKESFNSLTSLSSTVSKLRLQTLLSGEADSLDVFVEINSGAGGTEAQDWAEMLSRMYFRWAEAKNFKIELLNETPGEEAGIKSLTLKIIGDFSYGWLKSESGIHRLVRISPFDSNSRRHTSFASVWIYPVLDESINIEIEEKDLRIDTYRASGAGGQHVNKTESAIRITHMPSGIVVQCQNDRSQHKNKAQAFDMLRARLYELELRKREEKMSASESSKTDIGWGHQIRSYVLQPYQIVKDLRTNVERGDAYRVLDGDIDCFLEAALVHKVGL